MPSIPNVKFRLSVGSQKNEITNWKEPVDFWNILNKIKALKKGKQENFKAKLFNNFSSWEGMNNKKKIPKIGKIKVKIMRFFKNGIFFAF